MNAIALEAKTTNGNVGLSDPIVARRYIANATATAPSPKTVIPEIRPEAHTLKNGPGISGTGARKRQTTNPKRNAGLDRVPFIRRTSVPVRAATASSSTGRTTRYRAASGAVPKIAMMAEASQSSPQWYQACGATPGRSEKPDVEVLSSVAESARSLPRTA